MSLSEKILAAANAARVAAAKLLAEKLKIPEAEAVQTFAKDVKPNDAKDLMPGVLRALDIMQKHLNDLSVAFERDMRERQGLILMLNDFLGFMAAHPSSDGNRVAGAAIRVLEREKMDVAEWSDAAKRREILDAVAAELKLGSGPPN